MKAVSYVGDTFVTGDEIAAAVIDYGVALANAGHADRITVPAIGPGGPGAYEILIGPASQLSAGPAPDAGPELEDPAFVADIRRRIDREAGGWLPADQGSSLDWDV